MTQSWTTLSLNHLFKPKDEVSVDQLASLLHGRNFSKKEDTVMGHDPSAIKYNEEEIKALEEYCKKRGIIGVDFGNMSPHAILAVLGGKTHSEAINISKKGLING